MSKRIVTKSFEFLFLVILLFLMLLFIMGCQPDSGFVESKDEVPETDESEPEVAEEIIEKVAEFISFHAIRETANWQDTGLLSANPDGAETIIDFTLMEFKLEDGTKVGKAVIDIINGTTTTAIIEEHLFEIMDVVFYKKASNYLAVIEPIVPIEIEGDIVQWKVIDLKDK